MPLVFRRIEWSSRDYDSAVALRRSILRTPLGLDFTAQQLEAERDDIHMAAFEGDDLIGTVVLTLLRPQTVKLRQMAVAQRWQGRSVGSRLLAAAEQHALGAGCQRIVLAARVSAQAFYARHGYEAHGETYIEVTLPHISMWKDLGTS